MKEWKIYKIADIVDEISMGPFGSNIKVENFISEGIPVLNGSNLQGYRLNEDSFNYVSEEKANSLGKANAYRGDVVITHRGTLGQIIYIPNDSKYERYVISQSQFRLKLKKEIVRPDFLVYYFHTAIGQHKILMNASQVGVPALARPTSTFREVTLPIPPMDFQNKIMDILLSIDEKLTINKQINDNLELQAQNIFNHYFIDNPIELGSYSEGVLTDIAVYLNGLAMQKFRPEGSDFGLPVLKIKELGQRSCDNNSDRCSSLIKEEYIVNDGDVIFSWSGTLLVDLWCGGKCGLNQHLFKVTSDTYPKWFYYFWTKHHLDNFIRVAKDKAVTMGHIKRTELEKANIIVPTQDKLSEINRIMSPIITKIINHRVEMRKLAQLRDSLLPQLMSGELKINEIDC